MPVVVALAAAAAVMAAAEPAAAPAPQPPEPDASSLYQRLGGHRAVVAIVDDFIGRAASDPRANFFRKGHPNPWTPTPEEVAAFKTHFVQFVEKSAGAGTVYEGKDMAAAHKGMEIAADEFNAVAADLKATLDKFKVPPKEQAELLFIVAGTRADVMAPGAPPPATHPASAPATAPTTTTRAAPEGPPAADGTDRPTLYRRLGGHDAVVAVVNDFVARAAADRRVNFFRKDPPHPNEWVPTPEELAAFKKHLVQFIEVAAGGPGRYEGKDMATAHKGMEITHAEFDALAEDLAVTLYTLKVPAKERRELLAVIDAARADIVGR